MMVLSEKKKRVKAFLLNQKTLFQVLWGFYFKCREYPVCSLNLKFFLC